MPKGGFGNLIALPLQHGPRENGNSVFVDDQLRPHEDQWAFLSSRERVTPDEAKALLRKVFPAGDVLNINESASDYDESGDPWILPPSGQIKFRLITEPLPRTNSKVMLFEERMLIFLIGGIVLTRKTLYFRKLHPVWTATPDRVIRPEPARVGSIAPHLVYV